MLQMIRYQRRADGLIAVTIDSNVWNLFYDLDLDLSRELPASKFKIFIPREVEIEIHPLVGREDKKGLVNYIVQQISGSGIKTTAVFGFARQGEGPQRHGGFGFGTFQSENEREFYALVSRQYLVGKSRRGSQLTENEADAALGAASFSSVVLTCDTKAGPLKFACENGGKVLYMAPFRQSSKSLADYVTDYYSSTESE